MIIKLIRQQEITAVKVGIQDRLHNCVPKYKSCPRHFTRTGCHIPWLVAHLWFSSGQTSAVCSIGKEAKNHNAVASVLHIGKTTQHPLVRGLRSSRRHRTDHHPDCCLLLKRLTKQCSEEAGKSNLRCCLKQKHFTLLNGKHWTTA